VSRIDPETYNPEALLPSHVVHDLVIAESWQLSALNPDPSLRLKRLEENAGLRTAELQLVPYDMRGHRWLDCNQTIQECGSYKVHCGANSVEAILERAPDTQVIHIASAGNAAYGTLQGSQPYGLKVVTEATTTASRAKVGTLRQAGATVNNVHNEFQQARDGAALQSEQRFHAKVEAYDSIDTIAGQSIIGWNMVKDLLEQHQRGELNVHEDPITLFVPVGGGGLLAGIASVAKECKDRGWLGRDNVKIYGVQLEGCDAMKRYVDYVRAGLEPPDDLFAVGLPFNAKSDGTAVRWPGKLTAAIAVDPEFVTDFITVSEGELGEAMRLMSKTHNVMVEPAGALAAAGARQYAAKNPASRRHRPPETLITLTTGANVSPDVYQEFMQKAAAWRQAQETQKAAELSAYHDR